MWFSFFITWEQRKLGELGKAQSGIGFPDKEQGGKTGIPFFKVSDMNNLGNELVMHHANNYVSLEQIKKNGWSPIEEISVIFAKVGAAIMLNRKRLVRFSFLLDNNTMAYKFNNSWDIEFGRTLFERIDLTSLVQVGALPSYNAGDVENIEVVIPQKSEQSKLGALFNSIDNLITLHQRKYEKFVNIKKALLEKMFPQGDEKVPRIRFRGFTDAWEQRKFKDMVQIERGGSPRPIDDYITDEPDGLNWVKIGDAPQLGNYITKTAEKIKPSGLSKTREVHPGDLILSNSMSFGKPYIMGINGCIHDGWLLIRDAQGLFELRFLCHLLGTRQMLAQYKALASGSTVNNLNKELVGNTIVAVPNKDEQQQIGCFLESIDNLITLHQRKQNWQNSRFLRKISSLILAIAWEQRKAYNVADYSKGCGYSKSDLKEFGTPIILYGRLYTKYQFIIGEVDTFVVPKSGSYYSQGNEVIIPASGETAEDIARASAVGISGVLLGGDLNILHPYDFINPAFLALAISNGVAQKELAKKAQGKSVVHIHNSDIQEVPIAYPLRIEQEQIVGMFRNLDNLITLHQCKRAAFVSRKSPSIFQFEKWRNTLTWEQRKLGDVVSRFATGLNPRDNFTLNSGGKNYYVTIKNFTHGNLVLDDNCDKIDDEALALIQARSDLRIGDILFSSIGRVGDCFLIENRPINWNINESVFVLRPVKDAVDPLYLMHTIHSERVLSVILSCVTGSTFKSIKMAQLKETNIPYPNIVEQKQIGKFITAIDNLITLHQRGENIYNRRQTW